MTRIPVCWYGQSQTNPTTSVSNYPTLGTRKRLHTGYTFHVAVVMYLAVWGSVNVLQIEGKGQLQAVADRK
jgi:hypothetical protein